MNFDNLLLIISTINAIFALKNNIKDIWDKSAGFRIRISDNLKRKKIKKIQSNHQKKLKKLAVSQRVNLYDDNG